MTKITLDESSARASLEDLIRKNGDDFASISKMLGKNPAYVQQYIRRGSPRKLDESDRRTLAEFYGVDETVLGGSGDRNSGSETFGDMVRINQIRIGASAGPGSLADDDDVGGSIAFGAKWLKQLGGDPARLSLIAVDGDSMDPTLRDGDDIMVDHSAAEKQLRDGIYVLRMDDVLLVKRVGLRPGGRLSVRSDNPQYPNWDDIEAAQVNIIGRVVWTGRRL